MWYYCYWHTYQNHWYFFWINISGCSVNRISTDYILDPAARHRRRWKGRRWSSDWTLKLAKIEVSSIARQVLHSYSLSSSVHGTMLTAGLGARSDQGSSIWGRSATASTLPQSHDRVRRIVAMVAILSERSEIFFLRRASLRLRSANELLVLSLRSANRIVLDFCSWFISALHDIPSVMQF